MLVEQMMHEDEEAEYAMAQIRLLCTLVVALAGAVGELASGRRWWVMPRGMGSFETVIERWPEDLFREELRVGKRLFNFLCKSLGRYLKRKDTRWRKAVPVRRRVAIALKKLATGMRHRDIGHKFEVGKTTVTRIVHEFCEVIQQRLMPLAVRWPSVTRMIDLEAQCKHGIPNVVGAIDGSYIPITPPKQSITAEKDTMPFSCKA